MLVRQGTIWAKSGAFLKDDLHDVASKLTLQNIDGRRARDEWENVGRGLVTRSICGGKIVGWGLISFSLHLSVYIYQYLPLLV
mmetsp:Transcript_10654/g.17154  ORF Transcript_10654/g.17154 Transcript_10654/m.17154 type:complete len:83 (+) Transcript_10654:225-473(+)